MEMDSFIKGETTMDAISIIKQNLEALELQARIIDAMKEEIPDVMSLVQDSKAKLRSLLIFKVAQVRETCKLLGIPVPENLPLLEIPELPKELVEEILCRVPATYLKRLCSTCKRWNRLFKYDKRFAKKHFDTAEKQFMVLMLTKEFSICPMSVNLHGMVPSVKLLKGGDELSLLDYQSNNSAFQYDKVFHCEGLLFYISLDDSRMMVWNPLTGGTRLIETGCNLGEFRCFALGYDNNKSYKILSFRCGNGSKDSKIYEFDSDSWRTLDYDIVPGRYVADSRQVVSLNGKAYLIATDHKTETHIGISYLLCFDFETEKSSGAVPLPYQCHRLDNRIAALSAVREEKLALLLERDEYASKVEIWVTNKIDDETTKVVSWSKVLALDLNKEDLLMSCEVSYLLDEEKKILVWCDRWMDSEDEYNCKDMIYIAGEDNKVTQVTLGVDTFELRWPAILNYVPSLTQIQRPRGKRKRGE